MADRNYIVSVTFNTNLTDDGHGDHDALVDLGYELWVDANFLHLDQPTYVRAIRERSVAQAVKVALSEVVGVTDYEDWIDSITCYPEVTA